MQQYYDDFNSIKVRLKLVQQLISLQHLMHFNSIKVRLKLYRKHLIGVVLCVFQFHKGTIKTKKLIESYDGQGISIP